MGGGLLQLVAHALFCTLFWALLATGAAGQTGKEGPAGAAGAAEEDFPAVDPYTKGKPELVKQAGYVTLEPFTFAEGIQAQDMVEVLGGIELLWAETEHFKICSSLKTYKSKADQIENDALDRDIAQLTKKLSTFKNQRGAKIDPWLRLHLYALRLERLYTEFCQSTGFTDADFPPLGKTTEMGSGPWLGQKLKPTILLSEKSSTLARFTRQYTKREETFSSRFYLPGGSMFFGISAEALRENGFELDNALHCAVAASVVSNFLDGLRENGWSSPLWLNVGMGHWFCRRIDERFTFYADGTSRGQGDQYEWKPRVRSLVDNKFEYSWNDMLATQEWKQLTPQAHLLIWSRIDWMMDQQPAAMRKFLGPVTVKLSVEKPEERVKLLVERAKAGFVAGYGKTPEECETAWRAWVRKKYDR